MDPEKVLEHFRQDWKNEIQSDSRRESFSGNEHNVSTYNSEIQLIETEDEQKAARLFNHAVWLEDMSEVYEATKFYRKAISIDPDIEFKVYRQNVLNKSNASENNESCIDLEEGELCEDENFMVKFENMLADKAVCDPMFSQSSTHISKLPTEMLHEILLWVVSDELDMQSLDLLSGVSRGFYVLCRNSNIWKTACIRVWGRKEYNSDENEEYLPIGYSSWRQMFLSRPRLRLNGCYISRTRYYRKGESGFQDQSYEPYQCVSYYRYLRFFANGTVLMLTSAEPPQGMVALLKKNDCINSQVVFGRYMIHINYVMMNFRRPSKKRKVKTRIRLSGTTDVTETTIKIEMMIKPIKVRRNWQLCWNKYEIKSYFCTGKVSTALIDTIDTNKFPSLLFSRVKSYDVESEAPLI